MTRIFITIVALAAFCSVAQATPAAGSHQAEAAQPRKYWLSEDLNRLVFWETPAARNDVTKSKTDTARDAR